MAVPKLEIKTNFKPLEKLARQSPMIFQKAMEKGAVQFLNWASTGSKNESRKPPIRWGVLRGSASAFVNGKLLKVFPQTLRPGAPEKPTPATSAPAGPIGIPNALWVWNTDYATKMHEWKGRVGSFTQQDGDAGSKWLEKHLRADKDLLMQLIATFFKKEAGT